MQIVLTRPSIPILWLDTWCVLRLSADLDCGDVKRKENAEKIVDKIISLTQTKKLICPEGDQDLEISVSNNEKIVEKSREIQARMSLGISLKLYAAVEHIQVQRMMKAVITKNVKIEFPWEDIFNDDPVRIIDRNDSYIVSVHIPRSSDQTQEQIRVHKDIAKDWEALRQNTLNRKLSYDTTLDNEFKGASEAIVHIMASMAAKKIHGLPISDEELMKSMDIAGTPLSWWQHYSGKEDVLADVLSFYRSKEYTQIPYVNVGTRLLAELVSGNEAVSPSDVMDIHHISTVMPYSSYMVVDNRVRNRLEGKTKLLKEYPVKLLRWSELLPFLYSFPS